MSPLSRFLLLGALAMSQSLAEPLVRFDDSALQGDLRAPLPYETVRIFPELTFRNPVDFIPEPGSDRVFVIQVNGQIDVFDHTQEAPESQTIAHLRDSIDKLGHLYGMAFHPRYEANGMVYLCYRVEGLHDAFGTQVVECHFDRDTNQIDIQGRRLLITWFQGGHNGGSLQFGPDGYLYISTGDAEKPNPPDELKAGQDCSNLLSTIMRIDVDRRDPGLPYQIPSDNPFNDLAGARPEIWAFGFRNPWRMSFDRETGDLWVGDVGWDMWELIYRVQRGANYGWSIMEGRQPINVTWERGPVPISPPLAEHPHTEARSITGGYVYHGDRIPELQGAYIYGDYETGKIWALWQQKGAVTRLEEIADSELRIICFGQTWDGEVYIVDYAGGIYELQERSAPEEPKATAPFPDKLSATGLFSDLAEQTPSPGLLPYEINHARWSDGLPGKRWLALPQGGKIQLNRQVFPEGTLFVKTLHTPQTKQPIETQILQRRHNAWRAFSYAWDDDGQEATLVPVQGRQRMITLGEDEEARLQPWHSLGASECLACHNAQAGSVLGFQGWQLSEDTRTQMQALGLFNGRLRGKPVDTPEARTYLDVNCASCHRLNGGGLVPMKLARHLPNDELSAIGVEPQRGAFGLQGAQVIAAGQPERSTLYYRMAKLGSGRMPHLGSKQVDVEGLKLVYEWIESLDEEADRGLNEGDEVSRALVELHAHEGAPPEVPEAASSSVSDLYLRFDKPASVTSDAPPAELGAPAAILALQGDAARGEALLKGPRGALCLTCHQLGSQGRDFGPAFDKIGAKRSKTHLLESLYLPSSKIATEYVNYTITTHQSESHTGFIKHHDKHGILLRDAALEERLLKIPNIATMTASELSVMPAGLAQAFSNAELADLLAYLASLQ